MFLFEGAFSWSSDVPQGAMKMPHFHIWNLYLQDLVPVDACKEHIDITHFEGTRESGQTLIFLQEPLIDF